MATAKFYKNLWYVKHIRGNGPNNAAFPGNHNVFGNNHMFLRFDISHANRYANVKTIENSETVHDPGDLDDN